VTGRYDSIGSLDVPQDDGTTRPMSMPRVSIAPQADVLYIVRDGDRVDLLALAALNDSTAWWSIADANPRADALALEHPGTTIAIPNG